MFYLFGRTGAPEKGTTKTRAIENNATFLPCASVEVSLKSSEDSHLSRRHPIKGEWFAAFPVFLWLSTALLDRHIETFCIFEKMFQQKIFCWLKYTEKAINHFSCPPATTQLICAHCYTVIPLYRII